MSDRATQLKHANDCDKSWDSFDPDGRPNSSPTHSRINPELKATPNPDLRATTLTSTGRRRVAAECEPCTVQVVCQKEANSLHSIVADRDGDRPEDSTSTGWIQGLVSAERGGYIERRPA